MTLKNALLGGIGAAALMMAAGAVWADGLPDSRQQPTGARVASAARPQAWPAGCGLGVHVARINADADLGGGIPINIGSNGQSAGGSVLCDGVWGNFLAGAFLEYDRIWGDLHTLGLNSNLVLGGRVGYVVHGVLPYLHVGVSRVDGNNGLTNINGLQFGAGVEWQIAGPWSGDLRATHAMYDNVKKSGIDIDADEIRFGLNYKLNFVAR